MDNFQGDVEAVEQTVPTFPEVGRAEGPLGNLL